MDLAERVVNLLRNNKFRGFSNWFTLAAASLNLFFLEPCLAQKPKKQDSELFPGLKNPSEVKTRRYDLESDYYVTFTEISDPSSGLKVYEISINSKPNLNFNHIRMAGIIMSGTKVLEDKVQMFYRTPKSDYWAALTDKNGSDHALLLRAFAEYKDFVPPVATIQDVLEKLNSFFEWLDKNRENSVYPRVVQQGSRFLIPVDFIMNDINLTGLNLDYVNGVRLVVASLGENNNFFIKFKVGQYSAVPTASKVLGLEILSGKHPRIFRQMNGTISLAPGGEQTQGPYDVVKIVNEAFYRNDLAEAKRYCVSELAVELEEVFEETHILHKNQNYPRDLRLLKEIIGPESLEGNMKDSLPKEGVSADMSNLARVDLYYIKRGSKMRVFYGCLFLDNEWKVYTSDISDEPFRSELEGELIANSKKGSESFLFEYPSRPEYNGFFYGMTLGKSGDEYEFEFFENKGSGWKSLLTITDTAASIERKLKTDYPESQYRIMPEHVMGNLMTRAAMRHHFSKEK